MKKLLRSFHCHHFLMFYFQLVHRYDDDGDDDGGDDEYHLVEVPCDYKH